ncbi:butyrophilin subfamily 1 member A1-like [Archocentrus centrarchus]|uniref:butyrophilin subfamily 1 member A1-like n=1 Tax=Archocentrus centrarchus TaxID=63155 RepID=UPI0011EA1092|nr:butyrophilin subfamily 1 member A1-like [Archocentrus centrarchus]
MPDNIRGDVLPDLKQCITELLDNLRCNLVTLEGPNMLLDLGHSQKLSLSQSLIAVAGDDIVLPCQLEPPVDAAQMTIEWGKPDLNPRFVFVWHNEQELQTDQNTAYKGRVSLSIDKLKHGDVSLKLSKVKISDSGRYRCYIPKKTKEYFVDLLVGASSQPGANLAGLSKSSSRVMLDCESAGWYPEPELLWLDAEGNLLPAGPTETLRGPDDLYTVSSRVTVEKRHSNNITCRVQQKNINQSRETHIHVPGDFFMVPSNCVVSVTFSVVLSIVFVLGAAIFMWQWRQNENQAKIKESSTERQSLLKDLDNTKGRLDEVIKVFQKTQEHTAQTIQVLKDILMKIESQKQQFISQTEKTERVAEENEKKFEKVNRSPRYLTLGGINTLEVILRVTEPPLDHVSSQDDINRAVNQR